MTITIPVQFDGDFRKLNAELSAEMSRVGNKVGSNLNTGINRAGSGLDASGKKAAGRFGGVFSKGMAGLGAASGVALGGAVVAGFVKSSIGAFADFEQNLNLVGKALNATGSEMTQLSGLAKQLGADTVFSAGEASEGMLELAKSGFTAKETMAALPQVMNLAATEGLGLSESAVAVTNAMSQFGIEAENAGLIVNALAGASNASSASVSSLSGSLSLVGAAANGIGATVQETAGALAALADNGLSGSIAGTSLAAVLNRLVPTTERAGTRMEELGLDFTNAAGKFDSLAVISGKLQKAFRGMSDEQRKLSIQDMFGNDASTIAAVNALINTGAKGLRQYTKAAQDTDAAQGLADARMKGVKGSLERLSGAWDTLKISTGEALSPLVVKASDALGEGLGNAAKNIGPFVESLGPLFTDLGEALGPLIKQLGPALADVGDAFKNDVLPAFEDALPIIKPIAAFLLDIFAGSVVGVIKGFAKVVSGVFQVIGGIFKVFTGIIHGDWSLVWTGLKDILGGALKAILGVIEVWWNFGIIAIFKKGILFITRDLWVGLWGALKTGAEAGLNAVKGLIGRILGGIGDLFLTGLRGIRQLFVSAFQGYVSLWRGVFDLIRGVVTTGVQTVIGLFKGIPSALAGLGGKMLQAGKNLIGALFQGIKDAATGGVGFVRSIVSALTKAINDVLHLPLTVGPLKVAGKTILPEVTLIPRFADGTNFAPGGLALVGERGPELVNLPRGSQVKTAEETRRALAPTPTINVYPVTDNPEAVAMSVWNQWAAAGRF